MLESKNEDGGKNKKDLLMYFANVVRAGSVSRDELLKNGYDQESIKDLAFSGAIIETIPDMYTITDQGKYDVERLIKMEAGDKKTAKDLLLYMATENRIVTDEKLQKKGYPKFAIDELISHGYVRRVLTGYYEIWPDGIRLAKKLAAMDAVSEISEIEEIPERYIDASDGSNITPGVVEHGWYCDKCSIITDAEVRIDEAMTVICGNCGNEIKAIVKVDDGWYQTFVQDDLINIQVESKEI